MRRWRLHAAATLLGAALLCSSPEAHAQTSVMPSPADTSEFRELQVAYAVGPERSTLWFGARLYGASDRIFVLVPAAPGARVDIASDAWFEALRLATNPRIVPPSTLPPSCATGDPPPAGSYEMIGDANHTESLVPAADVAVRTFSDVVLWAQGAGLSLPFDQLSVLADLDMAGYRFVSIAFDPTPGETVLRTIRVASPGATARVPLLLSRCGASAARAFVWVLGEGKATPTGWPWLAVNQQDLAWSLEPGTTRSNYGTLWSTALDKHANQAWVLEAASHALLLSTSSFASGKASVPSVATTYFARAAGYGDAAPDFQPCVMRTEALYASASKVAAACASGSLAVVPDGDGGGCAEQAGAGEIDPAQLRCGAAADDFALAFSGMAPSKVWLTRWSGRIGTWQSRAEEPFQIETGAPLLPIMTCPDWDSTGCAPDAGGGGGTGGSSAGTDAGVPPSAQGGGSVPGGSGGLPGGSNPYDPGQDMPPEDDMAGSSGSVYVETSCWGDSTSSTPDDSSSSDSCGGDSSSSTDSSDGDTACGGDSSSSSSEDDGACAGSSSDSSDGDTACGGDSSSSSEGDSCSGSSSSGEDSACSGSSSSSSGGDSCSSGSSSGSSGSSGCSGGGSSSGGSDCSISPRGKRRGKLPMSAFTVLVVACLWHVRRWHRNAERRVDR